MLMAFLLIVPGITIYVYVTGNVGNTTSIEFPTSRGPASFFLEQVGLVLKSLKARSTLPLTGWG